MNYRVKTNFDRGYVNAMDILSLKPCLACTFVDW